MPAEGLDGEQAFELGLEIVRRDEIFDSPSDRFFRCVSEDLCELRVDPCDFGIAIDHDYSLWNPREQLAESCPLLLELAAEAGQRLQVRLQDIAAMLEDFLVDVAVAIRLVVENADGSEHAAIGPLNGVSQVRDHSR